MGRFARNQQYKLYGDGRLYDVGSDVLEKVVLDKNEDSPARAEMRKMLQQVHDSMPPWQAFLKSNESQGVKE